MQVLWAKAGRGGLGYRLIGQGPRARHDADLALLVDMAGHNADLALLRRDEPGQFGPMSRVLETLQAPASPGPCR